MKIVVIRPSSRKEKKFEAIIDGKTVPFGAKGMSDFTLHKDEARKQRYIKRHRGLGEDWGNAYSSGFYAYRVLWNRPTIEESIADMNRRFSNYHFIFMNTR